MDLSILAISQEGKHPVCGLSCLAAFTEHRVLKADVSRSVGTPFRTPTHVLRDT